jgi:hypothetical protein
MAEMNVVRFGIDPNLRLSLPERQRGFARKLRRANGFRPILRQFPKIVRKIGALILKIFEARTEKLRLEFDADIINDPKLLHLLYQGLRTKRNTYLVPTAERDERDEMLNRAFLGFQSKEVADSMTAHFHLTKKGEIAVTITRVRNKGEETVEDFILHSPSPARIGTNHSIGRADYTFIPPQAFTPALRKMTRNVFDGKRDDPLQVTLKLEGIERSDRPSIAKAIENLASLKANYGGHLKRWVFFDKRITSVEIILSKDTSDRGQIEIQSRINVTYWDGYEVERWVTLYSPDSTRIGINWG